MRRIDARRGTENFKALLPTEFELLTKNHQEGPLAPPIRSRVNARDPLTRDLLGGGGDKRPHCFRRVITPVWLGAAEPNFV